MLDDNTGMYYSKGKIISLTPTENLIMQVLIKNKDKIVTSKELLYEVWLKEDNKANKRVLRTAIFRLKHKLQGYVKIMMIRNVGYVIREV